MNQVFNQQNIRNTQITDLPSVQSLLKLVNLPIEGIEEQFSNYFVLEDNNDANIIGSIGLEIYNSFGLLRSLAILPNHQYKNFGSSLVKVIEDFARSCAVKEIFLLTDTATNFFLKHGYLTIDRKQVPIEIQASREFASICPQSATVMKKKIVGS